MKIWYACKVKHNKELEDGMIKQVTEQFLLDAFTYTEAETRIYEKCEENFSGEFQITQITKTNIAEVLMNESADNWYKSKVVYETVDGDSDKEVKINTYLLVCAENLKAAFDAIESHLNSMLVPFEIPSITRTSILEVYPFSDEENAIPSNLKPISEVSE